MWDLVKGLFATLWMLRAPVAVSALIFGGMAAINEVGSWHSRAAASETLPNACSGAHDQQSAKDPSC